MIKKISIAMLLLAIVSCGKNYMKMSEQDLEKEILSLQQKSMNRQLTQKELEEASKIAKEMAYKTAESRMKEIEPEAKEYMKKYGNKTYDEYAEMLKERMVMPLFSNESKESLKKKKEEYKELNIIMNYLNFKSEMENLKNSM